MKAIGMKATAVLLAALLAGLPHVLGAQERSEGAAPSDRVVEARATVEGQVTGPAGEPLADVQVTVVREGAGEGAPDPTPAADRALPPGALTDVAGFYRITLPKGAGTFLATAWAVGYAPAGRRIHVRAGGAVRLDMRLAERPIHLPQVEVVTASPHTLAGVPGATEVLGARTLETSQPVSTSEILRKASGIHVKAEDAYGLIMNVGLRGLDPRRSSRTLVLEDGAPIHLGPYGDPTARYQPMPEALDRIEILKGSGQILHGPHTVGGVVNFVTARPPTDPGGALSLTGGGRDYAAGHLRLGGTWGATGAVLDYARRQGAGVRAGERHRVDELLVKGVFGIGERHSLSLKGGWYLDDTQGSEAALTQAEFDADPFGSPFRHNAYRVDRVGGQAVHELAFGTGLLLRTNLYAQRAEFTTWRQAGSTADRLGQPGYEEDFACQPGATSYEDCGTQGRPRTYTFWGLEPRLSAPHRLFGIEAEAEVGARVHLETVDRKQFTGTTADARTGEITRDNAIETEAFSLFVQNRAHLGELTVTPGLRFERVRSSNVNRLRDVALEDDYTKWLPGVGVTWAGSPALTLFAGAHRGFAPPRPADVLNPQPGASLIQVDPEVSWNYELGLRAQPTGWADLSATAFRIDFDNQVVRGDLVGSGQTLVNAGETRNAGLEVAAGVDLEEPLGIGFYARAAYTWLATAEFRGDRLSSVDGETPIRGNRLPYAPEHLVSGSLGYAFLSGLDLRLDLEHVSDQFADDLNTLEGSPDGQRGLLPAYTLLHAAASYQLGDSGLTLFAAVKNLTDERYISDRQEGIVAGFPRFVTAGARWSF